MAAALAGLSGAWAFGAPADPAPPAPSPGAKAAPAPASPKAAEPVKPAAPAAEAPKPAPETPKPAAPAAETPKPAAPAAAPAPETPKPAAPAAAETPKPAAPVAEAPVIPPVTPPATPVVRPAEVRFQFDGIPYNEVVRRFAQMAGKPILGDFTVEGTVTFFDSRPYTFDEALDTLNLLLAMHNYTLIETPRYFQVVTLKEAAKAPLKIVQGWAQAEGVRPGEIVTMVVPLKFVNAPNVIPTIQPLVSTFGSVASLGGGRNLVITDRLENIKRVRFFLDQLDLPGATVPGRQMKVYSLKYASARDLATVINSLFGTAMPMSATATAVVPRYVRDDDTGQWVPNPNYVATPATAGGAAPGSDIVKATADDRTNTLFLVGDGEKLTMAEEIINRLDAIQPSATGDMRVFELKNAKAEDVANVIRQMLPGQVQTITAAQSSSGYPRAAVPAPGVQGMQARVVADPNSNRLIVTAPLDQMNRIEDIIKQLDQGTKNVGGIRVFRLKTADAHQLSGVIAGALRKASPGVPGAPGAAGPQVSADARTNSLVVSGTEGDMKTVEALLAEIDKPLDGKEAREIHVVQLKVGNAPQLAAAIGRMLSQQDPGRFGPGAPASTSVRVEAEPATNSLLISAAPGDWPVIEKILEQLKTSAMPMASASTRIVPLKYAKAPQVAETLRQLFGPQARAMAMMRAANTGQPPPVPVVIAASESSNSLLVSAAADDHEAIAEMVKGIDVPAAETAENVRILHLKTGDAVKVAETLRAMYPASARGEAARVFVQGDVASNSVLVRASDAEFKTIEAMVKQLDQAITESGGVKTFRLKVADAQQVATVLQSTLAKREGARTGHGPAGQAAPPTVVSADIRTNSVIIAGPAADIQMAETIIAELDRPLEGKDAREIHVVQLKVGDARQLADALTRMLSQQESGPGKTGRQAATNVRVEADTGTNSLLISAAPGDWPTVEKILEQLKTSAMPLATPTTRQIPLKFAKASELAETLRQVFTNTARGRLADKNVVPVVIAPSDRNNSLLVSAADDDQKTIADLVKTMDVQTVEGVEPMRMIRLESADAVRLAQTLKGMVPPAPKGQQTVLIEADPLSNSVIIRGPEADRKMFEDMIASLDKATQAQAREVRMIPLKSVSASMLATMLGQLYQAPAAAMAGPRRLGQATAESAERVVVAAAPGDRMLVVDGPREKVEEIVQLVSSLDVADAPGQVQVRTYRMANTKAVDLCAALSRLFAQQQKFGQATPQTNEPQPRFEADAATNQVMVAATPTQLQAIEDLIKKLEAGTSLARETRTFRLKNAKAPDVVEVLQAMLVDTQAGPAGRGRGESTGAETRVAAMAETNDIIVQGPPEKLALADQLIKTFDSAEAAAQSGVTVVQLKNAQAASLAEAVNASLGEKAGSAARRPGVAGAEKGERVTVTPEPNSNCVLVRGPSSEVASVVDMIRRLDEGSTSAGAQVRVYPLQNSEPAALATSLGKLFQDMLRQQGAAARNQQPVPFAIAADDRTKSLVISTTAAHFALVEQILKSLDQTPGAPSQDVQYIWLKNADATDVAGKLNDMYRDRKGADKPVISADSFANAVTIIAKDADLKAMEPIITKLDDAAKDNNFRVRVIPLTSVKAEKMAEVLKTVYSQLSGSEVIVTQEPMPEMKKPEGPVPVPEPPKKAVAPSAAPGKSDKGSGAPKSVTGKDRASAERAVRTFYSAPAPPPGPEAAAKPPSPPPPGEAAPAPVPVEPAAPGAKAAPAAAAAPAATPPAALSSPAPAPPAAAPAAAAAPAGGAPAAGKPGVSIAIDKKSNSLIISGKRQDLDYLEDLIEQLSPSQGGGDAEFRVFKVAQADAVAVARTLDALFNPRVLPQMPFNPRQPPPVPPPPTINVVADVRTKCVIIRAKTLDFELIEPLIKQLDQIPTVVSAIRVFPLKNTDAVEIANNIKDLFQLAQQQRQAQQSPQPQVAPQAAAMMGRQTPQMQRAEMVRQMMELQGKEGVAQVDVATAMTVSANRQTNSVIVAAPAEAMTIVERLIEELDQSGVAAVASVRIYPVKNADVRALVTALQEIFVPGGRSAPASGQQGRMGRQAFQAMQTAPGESGIAITGDEVGRLVIVSAPAEKHELIAKVIKEIDTAQSTGDVTVKVYRIQSADAYSISFALQSTFERGTPGGAGRSMFGMASGGTGQVRISADRSSNSVIVRASAEEHEKIAKLIGEMDQANASVVRMYPVKNADVKSVVAAVQDIFGAAKSGARGMGGMRFGIFGMGPDTGAVTVAADEPGRLIIVSAPADKHELIAKVINEIDQAQAADQVTVKVYRLASADATAVAAALQTTIERFAGPATGFGPRGGGATSSGQTRITADRSSNSLVVRASAEDHAKIAKLIQELDIAPVDQFAVRLILLNNADATTVAQVLARVFISPQTTGGRGTGQPSAARPSVVIEADRDARMVMVRADDAAFEKIKALAMQIDAASTGGQAAPTFIPLKFAQATAVAPAISQAFATPRTSGGGRGPGTINPDDMVTVVAEPMSNALIVTANATNLKKVQDLLAKIDLEGAGGLRTELVILKNAKAVDVAPALQQMAQGAKGPRGAGGATAGAPTVTVSADAGSNSLVITGPTADLDKVVKMARDLDQATAEPLVKMYPLKNADVRNTVTALQDLFVNGGAGRGARGGAGAGQIAVTGDETGRVVVVSAPKEKHELIAKVINELDQAQDADKVTVKVYRLVNAEASAVASALQSTIETSASGGGRGQVGAGGQVRLSADRSSNTLVVRASAADHEKIGKLITEMDVAPTDQYMVRLIPLNTGDATSIAQVLNRLFVATATTGGRGASSVRPAVAIEADAGARLLAVRADDPTFEKIKALATQLDTVAPTATPTLIPLKYASAASVAAAVGQAFAMPRAGRGPINPDDLVGVAAEPVSNSLLVTANAANLAKVQALVKQMDLEETGGIRTELVILKHAKSPDVAPILTRMIQASPTGAARGGPSVVVSPDAGSNGLVLSGPPGELDKVLKMATQLDQATSSSATTVRIIPLKNGDATAVATMVRDLYNQQLQVAQRDRKSLDPLAVSSDVRSNAIVLSTSEAMFKQVSEWVNQIEVMQPARGALKIITLQHADPTEVQKAIEQLYGTSGAGGAPVMPIRRGARGAPGVSGATTPGGKVETSVLPQQRSILINASDEDFETIQKLAEALDAAAADARRTLRVFALKNTSNMRVAPALTNLYRAIALRPATPGAPEDTVTVTALPDTNAVVVAASKERMEEVAHLIEQLDKVEIAPQLEFRIFPLTSAQPTKLMPVLTQMLAELRQTRPDEPINVQADERTKSLIVTARGPMFEQVEKIIKTLDKPAAYAETEVLIVPLKKADATRLAAVLTEMLQPSAANQATPEARALQEQVRLLRVRSTGGAEVPELDLTKPIKITADPNIAGQQGSNALVISSTPDNLKAMKAIVGILDSVPVVEGAKVRIHHLENADAASVVTVLKDIFAQGKTLGGKPRTSVEGRAEPESASGKALVNPFNVSADERTNTIVMSGIEESLALADLIVKDFDRDAGKVVTEVRLFRLKNADVTRLVPMLQAVFMEGPATAGTEGLKTQVTRLRTVLEKQAGHVSEIPKTRAALTIQADPTTSIVVVAARADMMPLIADIINTMDVPGAGSMNCVRIYPLANADATRLKTVIDGLYTGPNATLVRTEDKPIVQVDTRTNALVISASDKTFAMLTTLLAGLDAKTPIEMRDIKLVTLKNADATALAAGLQRMMDARVQRLAVISPADAEALRVIITPDTRSNSLMVGGSAEGFQLVKSLAEQLDGISPGLTGQIQLYPMKHANAPVVATTLSTFFTQRYAAARTTDVARERPVIMSDVRCNCLLVAANADDTKIIVSLLEKLDVELLDPSVQLVVIPLKFNDAGIVGPKLQQIFQARLTSMTLPGQTPVPQDRVDVNSDGLSNALIVSASKENLTLIKGLLEKLDVEPADVTGVVRMYPLQNSDAQRIQTLLQGIVQQGLYKPGAAVAQGSPLLAAREKVSITADVRTNILIVSASRENFAVIEEIIKKIDSTDDFGLLGDIRLFILKNADATRLAPTLQQLFTAKRAAETAAGGTGRMLPVSVFADPRTNTLLVTGSKESFNAVEAMVRELDTDQVLASNEFRIFYLKQATATVIAPTLTQLFSQRVARGGVREPVTIVTEARTNSLIVSASPDDLKVAESLINRLDAEPDRPGTSMQVFPIAKADATQVANTLKGLYTVQGAAAAGTPSVIVSVDERINAVVVSAGPADLKRISELVRELDTDTVPRVTEIRVFTLENADATELAQILTDALNNKPKPLTQTSPNRQSLLQFITRSKEGADLISSALQEGVLITPDKRTNSLVISAPVENMPLLESLVKAMDSTSPRTAQIRVISLVNADARQMATVLQQLFRMQGAAGVAAAAAGKQAIRYTLVPKTEDGKEAPSAVLGSAEEAALTVTVDVRTNSLLVGGTKHYVDLATKVVEELDASTATERLTEIYRLRNAKAQDIQVALTNFLTQERQYVTQSLTAMGGGGTSGGAQILLEREVAVVAEPISNTLLLSASPRYFDVIATIIQELDQPPPQVLIQVLLAEVTLNDNNDFGIDWNFTHLFDKNNVSAGTNFGMQAAAAGTGFGVSVTGGDISLFLRALESQGRVELLSRPQILASDNQHSIINIGQRVPFITNSRITENGTTLNTIQYQQIGIILEVTPRINPDGFVKLEVKPEISSLSTSSTVQIIPNVPAVVIDNRNAETTVTVQDGHTIIIGGLIRTDDEKTENKVPFFGDIPVLGWLFKATSVKKERKELLIILTPTVLRNVEEADAETQGQIKRLNLIRESQHDPMQESLFKKMAGPDADDDRPRVPTVRSSQQTVKPAAPAPPKEAAVEPRKP